MPIDPLTGGLVKFALDQIAKRLPDSSSKTRIRILEEVLRQTVDRNKELERVGDLLATVMAQRDRLQVEVSRQAIRIADLEARLASREGSQ